MNGLVPDQLTLPLQSETATGINGESIPSPQPDDGWQDRYQSLRRDVVALNPGIHSIELRERMLRVAAVWAFVDLEMTGSSINHHGPLPPNGHQDAPGDLRIPLVALQHVGRVPEVVAASESVDLYRGVTLLCA